MNSKKLCELVIATLEDGKATDIVKLDVHKMTTVTDFMVVASGTSSRHVRALANAVADQSREAGHRPAGIEGEEGSEWVLLDLHDVLVHVMLPRVREFYNLEKLWSMRPPRKASTTDG